MQPKHMLEWKLNCYQKGSNTTEHSITKENNNETGNALQCSKSPSLYQSTLDEFFPIAKYPKCANMWVGGKKLMLGKFLRRLQGSILSVHRRFSLLPEDFSSWRNNPSLLAHILHHYAATFFSGPEHSRKTHSETDWKSKGTEWLNTRGEKM